MRIALVYNEPLPSRYDALGEGRAVTSVLDSVNSIREVLLSDGHEVALLGLTPPLANALERLSRLDVDLVFNLFEGFDGLPETEEAMAKVLESLGRRFTGASAQTLALCLNKAETKQWLAGRGIATAPFQLLHAGNVDQISMDLPVMVKPVQEDASHGLGSASVVYNHQDLAKQVLYVQEEYGQPVLVEMFLTGREFSVSILGGRPSMVLPLGEIVYSDDMSGPRIMTYGAKWLPDDPAYQATIVVCPAQVPEALRREVEEVALAAYRAVGSPPYARVDLRCDARGCPNVLEVNPNPDLWPEAGMALQAKAAGMDYGQLIRTIVLLALSEERFGGTGAASHAA